MGTHLGKFVRQPKGDVIRSFRLRQLSMRIIPSQGARTLDSSGLNSINKVSSMTFVVSTSSTSLFKQLMRFLRAPEATEAG